MGRSLPHLLRFLLAVVCLFVSVDTTAGQIYRLPPPDTTGGNYFGSAVAVHDGTAVIGASGTDACGTNSGAAYVYRRMENGEWEMTARLLPADCHEEHFFGRAVAIDGDRVLVTSHRPFFRESTSNAVYVFERSPGTNEWSQTARLEDPVDGDRGPFASSISLDGDRVLVTSAGDASTGSGDGAEHGAAWIFERKPDAGWTRVAELPPSLGPETGVFGVSGALDGDRAVVAASRYFEERPGRLYVFERVSGGSWVETDRISGIDDFFMSVDIRGEWILAGESRGGRNGAGQARLFRRRDDGRWRSAATLRPASPYAHGGFGSEVRLGDDRALVSGFDEQLELDVNIDRVVYVFSPDADGSRWRQSRIVDVGDTAFGASIDIEGTTAVVGQVSETRPGQAYIVQVR